VYSVQLSDVLCAGDSNGSIDIVVSGNSDAYTFNWNGTEGNATLSDVPAGTYTLVVTDLFGDVRLDTLFVVNEPDALVSSINAVVNPTDNQSCDGSATVEASGGTPPYTYQWNDPAAQIDDQAVNLCVGAYEVVITDANGCISSAEIALIENDVLTLSVLSASFNAYPNPTAGNWQLELMLERPEALSMHIYDASGRLLRSGNEVNYPSGRSLLNFDFSNYAAGNYTIHVEGIHMHEEFRIQLIR
jgi:hypothetical protein